MNLIDTRDLEELRDNLKLEILEKYNNVYNQELDDYDDIPFTYFLENAEDEYNQIKEIDILENEIGDEFHYGCTLIDEYDFEEYCEELVKDCGYISKDFPTWIEIDWSSTADNISQDYTTVSYQGNTYYARV